LRQEAIGVSGASGSRKVKPDAKNNQPARIYLHRGVLLSGSGANPAVSSESRIGFRCAVPAEGGDAGSSSRKNAEFFADEF
jgi:hypothetical protein